MIYFVLGFCVSILLFLLLTYLYRIKINSELVNLLKINSKNYLKYVVNMANKNNFKFKNIIQMIQDRFEKNHKEIENLSSENYFLRNIIDVVDEGIIAIDKSQKICFVNERFLELFSCDGENLNGKFLDKTKFHWIVNFENINLFEVPDKYTNINISCSSFSISKNLKIYKFKNISEFKKLDYMSKEFISNITHELKTPLTSIIGFSETLKNVENEDDRQMFYDIINREAIRLNNLISDVLTFSEIESQNDISKQKIDVMHLLKDIRKILEPQLYKTNFKIEISGNKIIILNCEKYLHQIFMNIMDNSLKHSFGTTLKINLYEDEKNVYINFTDDGIGIPEEDFGNIFNRFYKVQNSKSKCRGTGLGLSIVKTCITKINGKINIFNNDDRGITFEIIIPKR